MFLSQIGLAMCTYYYCVLFLIGRQSIAKETGWQLLHRLALWSPKPRVHAQKSALPACPMADMTHAHACINPKEPAASLPHAEVWPLGASQRLGHAVPLGALRRAAACPPRQEVQRSVQMDYQLDRHEALGCPSDHPQGFRASVFHTFSSSLAAIL